MVDVSLEWTVVGCAVMWLVASLILYRGKPWTGWTMGVVIVFLEVLRYQIDAALSPLPHMIGLGVFGQRGVVTGRIVEEPERDEERVRFVLALEKVATDSTIFYLAGLALVTIKRVSLPADYGD